MAEHNVALHGHVAHSAPSDAATVRTEKKDMSLNSTQDTRGTEQSDQTYSLLHSHEQMMLLLTEHPVASPCLDACGTEGRALC